MTIGKICKNPLLQNSLLYTAAWASAKYAKPNFSTWKISIIAGVILFVIRCLIRIGFFLSPTKITSIYPTAPQTETSPIGINNPDNNCWLHALMQFAKSIPRFRSYLSQEYPPISKFFTHYARAQNKNQPMDKALSTKLRRSLSNRRIRFNPKDTIQEDATEIFTQLFSRLPKRSPLHCRIQKKRQYALTSVDGKVPMFNPEKNSIDSTFSKQLPTLQISLNEKQSFTHPIPSFFTRAVIPSKNETVQRNGIDGKPHNYPLIREENAFMERPDYLLVSLGRFSFKNLTSKKITKPVDIPLEIQLPNYPTDHYQLTASIHHLGSSPTMGHYVTYVKKNETQAFLCDDHQIHVITSKAMLKACKNTGYLLHYERVT
ncbi:MAG: hypothetical protein WCP39_02710 [Chlamydiota bacterium]